MKIKRFIMRFLGCFLLGIAIENIMMAIDLYSPVIFTGFITCIGLALLFEIFEDLFKR